MSRWLDTFKDHQIHTTVTAIVEQLDRPDPFKKPHTRAEVQRLKKVIRHFQQLLSKVDPELLDQALLTQIHNRLNGSEVLEPLRNFFDGHSEGTIQEVNDRILPILNALPEFQLMPSAKLENPNVSHVESSMRELDAAIDSQRSTIEAQLAGLGERLTALDKSRTEQDGLSQSLKSQLEGIKSEAESMISNWQSQFSEAQERRSTDFSARQKQIEDESRQQLAKFLAQQESVAAALSKDTTAQLENLLSGSRDKHKSILELHELVAGDSVAAGFLQNAGKERDAANFWRWTAIMFILATVGWLIYTALNASESTGWSGLLSRNFIVSLSLVGTLLFGAAFSAQQSSRHRNYEQTARRLALELKALDPFISSLDVETQKEIKRMIGERVFGGDAKIRATSDESVLDHSSAKVLLELVKALRKG